MIFTAVLILIIAAGIAFTGYLDDLVRKDFETDSRNEAALLYGHLAAIIEPVDNAVLTMSGSPLIRGALPSNGSRDRDRANAVLDRYQKSMNVSVCYLLNESGIVVASSNRNAPDSFMGKSFAFRPYFLDAYAGKPGRYVARGSVSNKRGYYSSSPVRNDAGVIIGVAVIKKDLDEAEQVLQQWPHSYMVSPDGIIFLSSEPPAVFRSLWPAAMDRKDGLARSRQFGELNFEPLLKQEPTDQSYLRYNEKTHFAAKLSLPLSGWSIVYLKDAGEPANYRLFGILATAFAGLLAMFGYFALARAGDRQRRAEERLQAEANWSRTFDAVSDLIAIIGADHRILRINQAMALRIGISPDEAIGRYCYELVHCTEGPIGICPHDAMLKNGELCSIEVVDARLGGEFSVTASPLRGPDGAIEASVHVMHDITELRTRERQIQSLNVRLQAIINSSPLAIVILDLDGAVTLWNPAAERMFGWTEQEALARPLAIVPPDRREEFRGVLERVKRGETMISLTTQRLKRDGRMIDVSLSASPIIDAQGDTVSYLGMIEDITARKRLETDLQTAQKFETIGLLAGGIAHDFNNTLNIIGGNIGFVKMLGVGGRAEEMLTDAEKACEKATELSTRLITFSRGGDPHPEPQPIGEMISEACDLFQKHDTIRFEQGPMTDTMVEADRRQIIQVLRSLLLNAIEAMPHGGKVRIDAQEQTLEGNGVASLPAGDYVRISIADEGTGISPEHLPKIFDPYFSTKDRYADRGLGLGLAVCWSIVRKHGGAITVESRVGRGTVFHVYLRAAQDQEKKGNS